MRRARTHKDLIAWQQAVSLASRIYRVTEGFPNRGRRGLADQMRRAALSVASSIAEGAARGSQAEYIRFLNVARGSLAELETQVYISLELQLVKDDLQLPEGVAEVGRLLSSLHRRIREHRERARGFQPPPPWPNH